MQEAIEHGGYGCTVAQQFPSHLRVGSK